MYLNSSAIPATRTKKDPAELLAGFCKALGHPARIKILKHLLDVDQCICGRIVEVLPLAQSTVSQHLKVLKESGLVQGAVDGPKTCYCVNKKELKALLEVFSTFFNDENRK